LLFTVIVIIHHEGGLELTTFAFPGLLVCL
jgi:hypothetical protein